MTHFLLTLILLGALQGFICGGLLVARRRATLSEKLLGTLISVIALANLNIFLWYQQLSSFWTSVGNMLPLMLFMAIGPLLLLYVRTLLKNEYSLAKRDWLHFVPVLFDLLPYLIAGSFYLGILHKMPFVFIDYYNTYVDVLRWISLTAYVGLAWKMVYKNNQEMNAMVRILRRTIMPFLIFQGIWLIFLLIYILPAYQTALIQSVGWFSLYIPLSALIYWIGFMGFNLIKLPLARQKAQKCRTYFADEKIGEAIKQLRHAMEHDELYLDPELNLSNLVNYSGLSQKLISSVLNQYMNTSFTEFVNRYRVEAFKRKICEADMQRYSIKGIALECGFSSLATFQRVFKQMTGQVPSSFRQANGLPTILKSRFEDK